MSRSAVQFRTSAPVSVFKIDFSHVQNKYRLKYTNYFQEMHKRPDRAAIRLEWIQHVVENPVKEVIQEDGRIRRWAPIEEMEGRFLRVIILPDGKTIHNAFFDRSFTQ